jgi:diguanylate cyclase (GGDEF)-like protein
MNLPDDVPPEAAPAERFYENAADRAALMRDVVEQGVVTNRETAMRAEGGDTRYCLLSARALVYRGEPHVAVGISDITALKKVEQQLRDAAMRDALTGIYNRRHFYEASALELERSRRYGRSLSLAMIDVDHFKEKNDRFGHVVGDELLVALAQQFSAALRKTDLFARYGGEEFVVLFTETEIDEAVRVTDRLRALLAGAPVLTAAGPVSFTISGGVAEWSAGDTSIAAFVDRADRALYRAKQMGRDRVERAA